MIAAAIGLPVLGLAFYGGSRMADRPGPGSARAVSAEGRPSRAVIEDCNVYAANAARDNMRIVKDGAIGGAVGAGAGAVGGAIADGDDGLGKGAGIGALVGAAAGALYGLNEENRKSDAARQAYAACIARGGRS